MATNPSLAALEKAVRQAIETLGSLRAENHKLAGQKEKLEKELAAAEKKAGAGAAAAAPSASAEVRQRLESLEKDLEALLQP